MICSSVCRFPCRFFIESLLTPPRIGAKAETAGQPIHIYIPFIAETQDEKMYRVVMDRERWFSVIMGEDYKVDVRRTEKLASRIPFPASAANELAFQLGVARGNG